MQTLRNLGMAAALSVLPACSPSTEAKASSPSKASAQCNAVRAQVVETLLAKHVLRREYPQTPYLPTDEAKASPGLDIMKAIAQVEDEVDCIAHLQTGL